MKAIRLQQFGGIENLQTVDIPVPEAGPGEVLVKVKAISINPVDVKTRAGRGMAKRLGSHMPLILGWDISGEVAAAGPGVQAFKKGDEVFGMVNFPGVGNAYAEYVVAPAGHLALKPANISHAEAAAATLAALTAWQGLVAKAKVTKGQKLLIHAAAGGVGHYAVQIGKYLGAHVIGTSSAANRDLVLSLGADEHLDYRQQPPETVVKDADLVLDAMGGEHTRRAVQSVKKGGTLLSLPGDLQDPAAVQAARDGGIDAYTFLVASSAEDMRQIADLLSRGVIRSHVSATLPFDEMGAAHLKVETGRTQGKLTVVL